MPAIESDASAFSRKPLQQLPAFGIRAREAGFTEGDFATSGRPSDTS
jgi:hypothetical protein